MCKRDKKISTLGKMFFFYKEQKKQHLLVIHEIIELFKKKQYFIFWQNKQRKKCENFKLKLNKAKEEKKLLEKTDLS